MDYTISIPQHPSFQATQLFGHLRLLLEKLESIGVMSSLGERLVGDRFFYLITCRLKRRGQEKQIRQVMGELLAGFICQDQLLFLIRQLIIKETSFREQDVITQIETITKENILSKEKKLTALQMSRQQDYLSREIARYFYESKLLALDGFMRFRMQTYRKYLSKQMKEAVEEYTLEKEYKDFIQLLKYFVSVQTSKIPLVHLIHNGKRKFELIKEDGSPLEIKEMEGTLQDVLEQNYSHEDLIVSTLLTVAPEQIVLHSKHPDENVIKTLLQIFEGRILLCRGCSSCGIHLDSQTDGK